MQLERSRAQEVITMENDQESGSQRRSPRLGRSPCEKEERGQAGRDRGEIRTTAMGDWPGTMGKALGFWALPQGQRAQALQRKGRLERHLHG